MAPQPTNAPPADPQPLPPGTSTQTTPWNATLYPKCAATPTTQPLAIVTGSVNLTAAIPTQIIGTQSTGQIIRQTYTIYANGSFTARDDAGNEFSFRGLSILPAGKTVTSLKANGTEAVQTYLTTTGPRVVANVSVFYTVKTTMCMPSGLKIKIQGTTGSARTRIALHLRRHPTSSATNGVWYDDNPSDSLLANASMSTKPKLGFDWSDSLPMSPAYLKNNDTLVYRVGKSFTIDPSVVGTSNYQYATGASSERKLFYNGNYLAFYSDGTNIVCKSSPDGNAWSASIIEISGVDGTGATTNLGMWQSGSEFFYALTSSGADQSFQYAYGSYISKCNIAWNRQTVSTRYQTEAYGTSVVVGPDRRVYVAVEVQLGSENSELYYANNTDTSLTQVSSLSDPGSILLPLGPGKLATIAQNSNGWLDVYYSTNSGGSWNGPYQTAYSYDLSRSSAVSVGDKAYFAGAYAGGGFVMAGSFDADKPQNGITENQIASGVPAPTSASISTDGTSFAIVYGGGNSVYYTVGVGSFGSWAAPTKIASGEVRASYMTTSYYIGGGTIAAMWTSGTSAPYSLRFVALPLINDPATSSPYSWSKPGISPYESYFSGLTEYVSPGNGLLGVSQLDLSLPGRGLDLNVGRVFSTPYGFRNTSPYQYDNYTLANLGFGWSLNFPWMGTNYLHLSDGEAYPYQWNGNTFTYHGAVDFNLFNYTGSGYYLYLKSGIAYHFGPANRSLLSITDPNGHNVIKFRYGPNHYISQITDTVLRTVTFAYYGNNQLKSITSGARSWTYAYSGNDLTSVTDPMGRVTRFTYGGPNGWLLKQVTYPTGGRSGYQYAKVNVLTELTLYQVSLQNLYGTPSNSSLARSTNFYYSVNGPGQVVWSNSTVSDGFGIQGYTRFHFVGGSPGGYPGAYSRRFDYDSGGNAIQGQESDYDPWGRIGRAQLLSPSGTELSANQFTYDDWGNLIMTVDNYNNAACFSYANTASQNQFNCGALSTSFYSNTVSSNIHDALVGSFMYQEQQNQYGSFPMATYYKYNFTGYIQEKKQLHNGAYLLTDYTYDKYGNLLSVKDANLHTTFFKYANQYKNSYLTLTGIVVQGKNLTQQYAYDFGTGFQTSATDAKGNMTSYIYDRLGRVTKVTYPAVNGLVSSKSYAYNDLKNSVNITDEDGHMVRESFDGIGRMGGVVYYNGTTPYSSETYTHNWQNQISSRTTPAGNSYSYAYDYLGRTTKITNPDTTFRTLSYDIVNNLVTATNENGNVTQQAFDRDGRLIDVYQYYSKTQAYLTWYVYDSAGNLLIADNGNGTHNIYQYDDLNRLVSTKYPYGHLGNVTYDNVGNVATTVDPKGNTVIYQYDEANRLGLVTFPNATFYSFTYDPNGNMLSMSYPAQSGPGNYDQTLYTYDARNRVSSATEVIAGVSYSMSYTYDGVGNVVSTKYPDKTTMAATYDALNRIKKLGTLAAFSYTLDNLPSSVKYGNGQVATYSYTKNDQPARILEKLGSLKQLDLNYTYDKAGDVKGINTESYGYDALSRLTSAKGPWGTIAYTYDAAGNRKSMVQGSSKTYYTYGLIDELAVAGSTTYTYDANGNLVSQTAGTTTWSYRYDYENNLVSVKKGSAIVQRNVYDAAGMRVEKVEGATKTVYMYQGSDVVYYNAAGTVTKVYYADGMEVARTTGATTYYFHADEIGSVRLESTSSGGSFFSSNYEPYGPQYGASGSDTFRYVDKPLDTSTGLYYFGARFYDPTTGRFLSRDPMPGSQGDPQSFNPYAYARDNPLTITDTTGLSWNIGDAIFEGLVIGIAIATLLPSGGFSLGAAAVFLGGYLAANAIPIAIAVAAGGAINLGANTVLNGGRVTTGDVELSFGLAIFGTLYEGGGDAGQTEEAPWTSGMKSSRIGSAGEGMVTTEVSDLGRSVTYQPRVLLPNGKYFKPDMVISDSEDATIEGSVALEIKAVSFRGGAKAWTQLDNLATSFPDRFGYVFLDIPRPKPNSALAYFVSQVKARGGFVTFW